MTTREIYDKNSTQKQFVSSQVFHRTPGGRVREITAGVNIELGNLESFGPVTPEIHRLHPAILHSKKENSRSQAHYNFDCKTLRKISPTAKPNP
jgi:hypothetical protein